VLWHGSGSDLAAFVATCGLCGGVDLDVDGAKELGVARGITNDLAAYAQTLDSRWHSWTHVSGVHAVFLLCQHGTKTP
jgi:hypothetical protein